MKKDKIIQKNLELYAESFKGKAEILSGAYTEMNRLRGEGFYVPQRNPRGKEKRGFFKRMPAFFAIAAAAVAVLFILSTLVPENSDGDAKPSPPLVTVSYKLSDLTREEISRAELPQTEGMRLLDGDTDEKFFAYYKNGTTELYVLAARYKSERGFGMDEVTVITDFKGGLTDYNKDSNYPQNSEIGRNYENYKDGEYYSYLYVKSEITRHYVLIMSPTADGGVAYEQSLFPDGIA